MSKTVRIIALVLAILMGISAIGMIAMYVSAETCDVMNVSTFLSAVGSDNGSYIITNGVSIVYPVLATL